MDEVFSLDRIIAMDAAEAEAAVGPRRARIDGRVIDPRIQLFSEYLLTLGPQDRLPTPTEARALFTELTPKIVTPHPALARIEDFTIPGPAGPLPARLFSPRPAGATPSRVLLYLHGGGWVQGSIEIYTAACGKLAAWGAMAVVAVDYRLAPESPFPAGVEDCLAVWRWLATNASSLGGDPTRMAVGGDSAGGNLSAIVCQQLATDEPRPTAQLLIYPWLDATLSLPSAVAMPEAYILPRPYLEWFKDHYLPDPVLARDPRVSPFFTDDLTGQPPAMIVTAGFDPLRDDGELYADKLGTDGVPVTYREYAPEVHGFINFGRLTQAADGSLREMAAWLRDTLGEDR
ncbi:MAG: alpha/beta hydrolase [Geminicoccaceae bacterium]